MQKVRCYERIRHFRFGFRCRACRHRFYRCVGRRSRPHSECARRRHSQLRDHMTRIGDDYVALASVALCNVCEETNERFLQGDSSTGGARSRSPRGVRNAAANDCPPGEARIPREPAPSAER